MDATTLTTEQPRRALVGKFDKSLPPLEDYDQLLLWCEMLLEREPVTGRELANLLWKVCLHHYDKAVL